MNCMSREKAGGQWLCQLFWLVQILPSALGSLDFSIYLAITSSAKNGALMGTESTLQRIPSEKTMCSIPPVFPFYAGMCVLLQSFHCQVTLKCLFICKPNQHSDMLTAVPFVCLLANLTWCISNRSVMDCWERAVPLDQSWGTDHLHLWTG